MASLNIFEPQLSRVVSGMEGKSILIYGPNRSGKTSNIARAPKPLFLSFEKGLNAINDVPYFYIDKWQKFLTLTSQLCNPAKLEETQKVYKTIVIDTIQGITDLADEYICNVFGIKSIGDGHDGFGCWKEFEKEMGAPIKSLCSAGYTMVFLGHEMDRVLSKANGKDKVTQLYPKTGDAKRCTAIICDLCDIIAYAQTQPCTPDGQEVLSTLYLKGTPAFYAGSRFKGIVSSIPAWDWNKLVEAVDNAIKQEESDSGVKATTFKKQKAAEETQTKLDIEADKKDLSTLVEEIGTMLTWMNANEGSVDTYNKMKKDINCPNFLVTSVNEKSSEEDKNRLIYLHGLLVEKGYYDKAGLGQEAAE